MITVIETILDEQTAGTSDPRPGVPGRFSIQRAYPNPFNPATTLQVSIPHGQPVELDILDVSGRWVDTIYSGRLSSGIHRFRWNPSRSLRMGRLGSGLYLAVLRGETSTSVIKLLLLK